MTWSPVTLKFDKDPYESSYPPERIVMPPRPVALGDLVVGLGIAGQADPRCKHPIVEIRPKTIVTQQSERAFTVFQIDKYGLSWYYADDPAIHWLTDLEIQCAWIRNNRAAHAGAFIPREYHPLPMPLCKNCGEWPCKNRLSCPDYLALAIGKGRAALERAERQKRWAGEKTK